MIALMVVDSNIDIDPLGINIYWSILTALWYSWQTRFYFKERDLKRPVKIRCGLRSPK